MAVRGDSWWPSVGRSVATYGEFLMAADTGGYLWLNERADPKLDLVQRPQDAVLDRPEHSAPVGILCELRHNSAR